MEKEKITNITPEEEGLRRRIGSNHLIGCYKVHCNGSACFVDIRGEEGDMVRNPITSEYDLEVEYFANTQLTVGKFYSFLWALNSENKGKIVIKGDVRKVQNEEFIKGLFDAKLKLNGSNLEVFNNFQKTIFNEVTGAQHTYIYELLQNSNDYPYNGQSVSVKFILSEHYLFFFHTGDYFNLRNIVGLSSINQGEKKDNTKAIGYKGIGFKTVFANNDFVYLRSGDWSLRFDQKYSTEKLYGESPWALMPIPTNINELDDEARLVIDSAPADMRVQFALRHKSDASQNLEQLDKVFSDNQILLFIPNVHKVEVIVDKITRHKVEKDPSKWIVSDFEYTVSEELKSLVAESVRSNDKIPEKFKDIDTVRISFAVGRDGDIIVPIENARVYNYLPTELRLGFKFLFNADFVPNGSRSGLHDIEWNNKIMQQCGRKFADWWVGLLQNEGEYDISSVFSILPDNYKSMDNYTHLFLREFRERLSEIPCIPTIRNGEYKLCKLSEIVDDDEGFIVSDAPILTDEEFYKYCGGEYTIAHQKIRCDKKIGLLLCNSTIGKVFTSNDISNLCLKTSFASWLKIKSNNTKFLGFLLNNGCIDNCWNYSIFLKSDGSLSSANKIHYDIDKYIDDISFLSDELPRLDIEVRDALKCHNNWAGYSVKFKTFSIYRFTKQIIDNFEIYENLFHEKRNSANFVHFLSVTDTDNSFELPTTYPLWLDDGNVTTERTNLFIRNAIGDNFKSRNWIDDNWICYIDNAYFERNRDKIISYLSKRSSIIELKNKDCYRQFISSDKYISQIAEYIKNKDVNIDFYHYLFDIQEEISNLSPNIRKLYTLLTTDGSGIYYTPITNVIFKNDDQCLQMAQAEWMPDNCCVSVIDDYFAGLNYSKAESFSAFLSSKQIVQNFSIQELFSKCIKSRITDVYAKITTKELSKDFLNFIFTNRTYIFKGDVTEDYFKDIPIQCLDKNELITIQNKIYITNNDVMILYNEPWFNRESIAICDTSYTELFDGKERLDFFEKIGLKSFERIFHLRSRILYHINNIAEKLRDRKRNIAFHDYICSMHEELSEDDFKKIKCVPIYVSSPTNEEGELFDRSTDLSLPSPLLTDIINQDLVPTSILGSIHPDYITSESSTKYFADKLGNREMDIAGFIEHITENEELVSLYLRNKERNIRFWRWVYKLEESVDLKSKLKHFPVMYTVDYDHFKFSLPANMYLSDDYSDSLELESFINEYVPNADFLSSLYKADGDINSKWKSLFKAIGVKVNTKDIVFKNILPELVKFKQKSIVPILAEYVDEFASDLQDDSKKDNLSSKLKFLQLHCVDGTYRAPTDVIVSGSYFDVNSDTFNEIEIGNLLSEYYISDCGDNDNLRRGVVKFIKLIADNYSKRCETKAQLREAKLRCFIENQEEYLSVEQHFSIISQLADEYNDDKPGIGELIEELNLNINLYTNSDEVKRASALYLSSAYLPDCDFMANGINELDFINESYCRLSDVNHKQLFLKLGARDRFAKEHLMLLHNDQFSKYFWESYAPEEEYSLKHYITDEVLKNIPCIPTKNGVSKPSDLYDYRQQTLQKIVLKLANGESYLPSVILPKWIDKIGLRGRLYIPHCFEYLNLNSIDYRREVIRWITETDDEILNRHKDIVAQYTKNALWLNGAKVWVALNKLVAIEWGNETLKGSFGGNKYICSPSYMPESQTDYCKLCDILEIKILNNSDFKKDKDGVRDKIAISKISKCLTYLAWKSERENWQEIDKEYQDNLSQADIYSCKSISYFYNENIKANPKSYTEDSKSLWYVGMWNGPMFGKIQEWIKTKINIKGEFDSNFMDDLFLDEFDEFIARHEGGKLPEELHTLLSDTDKLNITVDEYANAEQFEYNNEINNDQLYDTDSLNDRESDDSGLKPKYNNNQQSSDSENLKPYNSYNRASGQEQAQPTYNPRSEIQTNNESRQTEQRMDTKRSPVGDRLRDKWDMKRDKVVGRPVTAASQNTEEYTVNNSEESSPEPFFASNSSDNTRKQVNRDALSRAKQNITKKRTEAKNQADKAADQLELFDLWQAEIPYTYIWYKYLMELQNGDKNRTSGRNVTIDFLNYEISDNGEILRLSLPSVNVPKWIEEANVVGVTLVGAFAKLKATIIRVTELEVELLIDSNDATKIAKGQKVRVYAEQTINFIDSLETRFIQLDYSDDYNLQENLPDSVGFIYGPPGTGKTTKLVERLHNIISETDESVNILVLTPTNKAADVIAYKLFYDKTCYDHIKRYGSTESSALIESGVLVTRDTIDMTLSDKNIVIATSARYSYDFLQPNNIAICDYPWDYIIIDEASMIDLVTITYILHKGNGAHFIIAGDPKQIEPISQNNIEIQNIYELVGLDSFEDAVRNYDRFPVETLMVQHRSTPTIGNLISEFTYNGLVDNDLQRDAQKPLELDGIEVKDINFVGFKIEKLDKLYGVTAINNSAFHLYAAIFTYNMVEYVVEQITQKYPNENYTIGIVCPYGAEANVINQLLENRSLNRSNCKVTSGTVHKFQGDECDIMFIVLNPPMNVSSNSHINKDNIINVAMSRARDYIFFVLPEGQIDGYNIKNRLGSIIRNDDRSILKCPDIESILFNKNREFIYQNTNVTCHMPVNVYYNNSAKYNVRIDDMNIDIQVKLD